MIHSALEMLRTPRFSPLRMMLKNRGVFGVHIGHLWHRHDVLSGEMQQIIELLEEGVLDPVVDTTFPLEEAARAHHYIQDRKNRGKVVLTTR
jgi:NADPH:quinone reductase-like Zn-dependent oxidoreductase